MAIDETTAEEVRPDRRAAGPTAAAAGTWLLGFAVLCLFALTGQLISGAFRLPVPGSVIGLILLLVALLVRVRGLERLVRPSGDSLLAVIPVLLVPLAVGVIDHGAAVAAHLLAYVVAIVVSWLLCALAAGGAYLGLRRLQRRRE